jgi:hypothetical protein
LLGKEFRIYMNSFLYKIVFKTEVKI